jgi:hypothetical protein
MPASHKVAVPSSNHDRAKDTEPGNSDGRGHASPVENKVGNNEKAIDAASEEGSRNTGNTHLARARSPREDRSMGFLDVPKP